MEQEAALVFVEDDDKIIASTVTTILQRSGFAVGAFTKPLDVLKVVETRALDVLLSDVIMRCPG